ncbi:uncharacterized protein LOC101897217 [Musca domestica]|uniref:Uncharacterized protein LOC101897217 n=1 Tax=Musca domestica TaxID=7370 RepID=A0A1I8MKG9_MUSDO|nr:uncharacterized protein LOC101897217 [Musca domestica]
MNFISTARPFIMDFDSLNYEFNPRFVKSMNFKLIPYDQHNAVNVSIFFRRIINSMRIIHWVTTVKANGEIWKIYNVTVNGCDIIADQYAKQNTITEAVIKKIREKVPQLPRKCPFTKDTEFSLINFYLDEEMMPVYLPNIKFETAFNMYTKNDYLIKIMLNAHVESKKGQRSANGTRNKNGI